MGLFIFALSLLTSNTYADNGVEVSVDARVRYEANQTAGDDLWSEDLRADDINVILTAQLAEKIRMKIKLNLAKLFPAGGDVQAKLEAAVDDAYIEIREVRGTPIAAIIFGKKRYFGDESFKDMADYRDSLLYNLFNKSGVIGMTVQLKEVLGFAIAASAFENGSGDLQFGDGWGFSVQASRQLTENLKLRGQAMMMQRGAEDEFGDKRATVGLIYTGDNGTWNAYVDGLWFDGQGGYLEGKNWAVQAGAKVKAGPGTVRVLASYLERTAYEVAAAYDIPVSNGLVVSPTVRYTTDENGNYKQTTAVVEARVKLSPTPKSVK